jgi:DNA polymerase-4
MMLHRVVLHADMDAFFASVEQRDRPELRGRPVIVGGRSARGVVSSASYEARAFGVRAAMPTGEALRLCPQGVLIPGEMRRYQRESRRIFAIFGRFTPLVEGLSLDEAFLDLTGCERLLGTPRNAAERLRREVHAETGLVVSVGIAPVKLVAKIASDLAKPDGCLEVRPDEVRAFLEPLPVGRLFGIGPVAEQRLTAAGLRTLGDVARADPERLARRLGPAARRFVALARGDDPRAVEPSREAVSLSEENTFEQDVTDHARIADVILAHADAVARRLRASGLRARTVVLKLKLARRRAAGPRGHPLLTRRTTLDEATDASLVIAREARVLLDAADLREAVRLVGVGVTGLEAAEGGEQLGLFEAPRPARRESRLDRALDAIHARFGPESVVRGTRPEAPRAGLSLQHKRGEAEPG